MYHNCITHVAFLLFENVHLKWRGYLAIMKSNLAMQFGVIRTNLISMGFLKMYTKQKRQVAISGKALHFMFKDSGNSSSRSPPFRIIYYHQSHNFKDINFKLFAVLGNSISFYSWKQIVHLWHNRTNKIFIKNDFGILFVKYWISHIFVENSNICK